MADIKLPYLSAPGNIPKALEGIKKAATPPKVSQDFVKEKLKIPGGSGSQMTTFLKRIGFANSDGTPTERYKRFRGSDSEGAIADAIREAYAPLFEQNEYLHEATDDAIKETIIHVTGHAADSLAASRIFSSLKQLMAHADFDSQGNEASSEIDTHKSEETSHSQANLYHDYPQIPLAQPSQGKLNIGYTINLNLPETSDIEVFNAIFKSIKEHLLRDDDV